MEKLPEEPVIVRVHPMLAEELNYRKEQLEQKTGLKINGGMPIVSKIVAIELRRARLKDKRRIQITVQKRKGERKNDYFFL